MNDTLSLTIERAEGFVWDGCYHLIHDGNLTPEKYIISPSPVSTALAAMAMTTKKDLYKDQANNGLHYLNFSRNSDGGWGRTPIGKTDKYATTICQTAFDAYLKGATPDLIHLAASTLSSWWLREVPKSILGLAPDSSMLKIIETLISTDIAGEIMADIALEYIPSSLGMIPPSGRPLIIALACIRKMRAKVISPIVQSTLRRLVSYQSLSGSWSEDVNSTSLCVLCLNLAGIYPENQNRALSWLASIQYRSGAWPCFARMANWNIGITSFIAARYFKSKSQIIRECGSFLAAGANLDGSYGMLSPYSYPDLDDTAVVLRGLKALSGGNTYKEQIGRAFQYLVNFQNLDGSWSTFSEVTQLPPYCSSFPPVHIKSMDVTVHVLQALLEAGLHVSSPQVQKGLTWLAGQQELDGSWKSTWYIGNTYATAQVLELLSDCKIWPQLRNRAVKWLAAAQKDNGSWPAGSAGECGLAVTALLKNGMAPDALPIRKGIERICSLQLPDGSFQPAYGGTYVDGLNYEDPISDTLAAVKALRIYEPFQS